MSSILSTQNLHSFLRRKYCFLPAMALSPPVGLDEPLMGLPPRCSAMLSSYDVSAYDSLSSPAATVAPASGAAGAAGTGTAGAAGMAGEAGPAGEDDPAGCMGDAIGGGGGRRAARLSRCFF